MRLSTSTPAIFLTLAAAAAWAGPLDKTECIAPAKPGGGFDLTCKLAQSALMDGKYISDPMRVTYMPGGIGAVAYNAVVAQRPDSANTIVNELISNTKELTEVKGMSKICAPSWFTFTPWKPSKNCSFFL